MSEQAARGAAEALAAWMRRYGVAVSVELRPGVSTSGWGVAPFVAAMSHHTVSTRAQGMTPCYGLVRNGRGGPKPLPGPLANGYGGFDEVYRIVTMGWANHPGAGGPLVVAGARIPENGARPYVWGTEYEGGVNEADWTPSFRAFMGRANAAILAWMGRPIDAHIEHKTWAGGRKIDRLGYSTDSGRAEIAQAIAGAAAASTPPPPVLLEERGTMYYQAATAGAAGYAKAGWMYKQEGAGPFVALTNLEGEGVVKPLAAEGKVRIVTFNGNDLELLMAVHGLAEFEALPALPPLTGLPGGNVRLAGPGRRTGRVIFPGSGGYEYPQVRADVDPQALAESLRAPLLDAVRAAAAEGAGTLSDGSVDRIRDAAVEALELVVGTLQAGGKITHARASQG